jgi:DNA transformation protein and related proteins
MAVRADFANYCSELLSSAGRVHGKRMFGGYGLYVDNVFVAIVAGETLYLKTDEQTQQKFAEARCTPFQFTARGKQQVTSYWNAPAEAMDSAEAMAPWARLAIEAAVRVGTGRRRKR